MAFQLLLLREPRTLVLASPTYSLLFSSPPSPSPSTSTSSSSTEPVNVVLKLLPTPQINLDNAVVLAQRAAGCMGIISIAGGSFPPPRPLDPTRSPCSSYRHLPRHHHPSHLSRLSLLLLLPNRQPRLRERQPHPLRRLLLPHLPSLRLPPRPLDRLVQLPSSSRP